MNYIKFKTTKLELIGSNITATRLQATISGKVSLDTVLDEVKTSEEITTYDGDEVTGVYDGYTNFLSLHVQSDGNVSVELENADVMAQIDALTNSVSNLKTTVVENSEGIASLNESQDEQDDVIAEIMETV